MFWVGFLQVIFRYVLKIPIPWAEELVRYLFVWLTLLGGAAAVRTKAHIAMELVVNRLHARLKLAVIFVSSLVSVSFLGYLAVSAWQLTLLNLGQRSDAMGISMAYPYMAIPVGAVLMIFFILELTVDALLAGSKSAPKTQTAQRGA